MRLSSLIWLSPIAIAAACASTTNPGAPGNSGSSGSSGGSGSGSTSGNGGSGSGASGASGGTASGFAQTCSAPAAGSPILRLLTHNEFDQTLNDVFPQVAGMWTDSLPSDNVSSFGFVNDQSNQVGGQLAEAMLDTALSLATALVGAPLNTILPCAATSPNHACAETFVNQYGKRLFRRPITTAEHDRYLAFFDASLAKSDFPTAIKWMTVGLIQSPNAVYRSEIGTVNSNNTRTLTPYEVATEISYTYTGSTPTSDLLTQADSGNLGDLKALAKSLVSASAGKQELQNFFGAYLGYTAVTAIEKPNVATFASVAPDMVQETQTFIDTIVFQQGGGLKDLLTSNMTTPSKNLATFYGFPVPATDYAPITRPSGQGIGILAQGAFLASHANATASSPTQRGLFPFTRLLCGVKPPVPANVPPITAPQLGVVTTRERYEVQHDDLMTDGGSSYCGNCHRLWDPIGFGFEHFDEAGRYRATEGGLTIDPSGWVLKTDGSATLFTFPDEEGLVNGLAGLPDSYGCFAGYLATYAYGTSESCLGASNVSALQNGTVGIADAFAGLAGEVHFTTRSAQ